MIRHKVSYFLSIAVVLVLLFFFPKPILLAVLLLEIARRFWRSFCSGWTLLQ